MGLRGERHEIVHTAKLRHGAARRRLWRAICQAVAKEVDDAGFAPTTDRQPSQRPPAHTAEFALSVGQLILIVEDNPINRQVLHRQLATLGYAVEEAEDGAAALLMWQDRAYGLIITDCHMPKMDGFALTAAIRRSEQTGRPRTPIVTLTAGAMKGERERCLAAGMDDYIAKPVGLERLKKTVEHWIGPPQHHPHCDDKRVAPRSDASDAAMAEADDALPVFDRK